MESRHVRPSKLRASFSNCHRANATSTGAVIATMLEPDLPRYKPSAQLSGEIRSAGEDTMETLVKLWAEAFRKMHPNVQFRVEAKGGTTMAPALLEGTADIGVIGRDMMPEDVIPF